MPFPCGSGPEGILHPHGLELLREVLVQTHLREVLPNYLLWHCSRSWSPQSPPSFPQRRLWSVWQLLYWMLLVVHTWLIKIIPLRLYTLIVHSSDNITVHFSGVCKKILEQFFLFLLLSRWHWCHQKPPDFQDEFSIWSQDAALSAQFHLSPICHWPLIFKYWRGRPISV